MENSPINDGGSPVKEGTSYHIHYTDDLNEYYMTGSQS